MQNATAETEREYEPKIILSNPPVIAVAPFRTTLKNLAREVIIQYTNRLVYLVDVLPDSRVTSLRLSKPARIPGHRLQRSIYRSVPQHEQCKTRHHRVQ